MSYKVIISDGIILEKSIESITFNAYPPSDNFYEMRDFTINSMTITGKIGAGEKTISLYKWSLLPANNPNCYKEIVVEQTHADQTVRIVKFSKAFVVDYSENFSKGEGVGHFSILIRQLAEVDINIDMIGNDQSILQTAVTSEAINLDKEIMIEPVETIGLPTKETKNRLSFSERFAKTKNLLDNVNNNFEIVEGTRPSTEKIRITVDEVVNELKKTDIGRETLQLIKENNIDVLLSYEPMITQTGDKLHITYGLYDHDLDICKTFVTSTKTVERTAQNVIHEVTHNVRRKLGISSSKQEELMCRLRQEKQKYNPIPLKILKEHYKTAYKSPSYAHLPDKANDRVQRKLMNKARRKQ